MTSSKYHKLVYHSYQFNC